MDIGRDLQKAYDDGYNKAIEDFAEWIFGYIDGYYFKSKEDMLAKWEWEMRLTFN